MLHHDSHNDLDVQRLMHEIRASVAGRDNAAAEPSVPLPGATNGDLKETKHYHVNDLLRFHGDEFVSVAYRTILCREPDEAGMAQHLEGLASGRFNKIDVLASLRSSPEGRRAQVRLDGLSLPVAVRRLGRVPVIGYFVRVCVGVLRLPNSIQHQNRFEFYTWLQQRTIVEQQNQHHKESSEALQQISAQILAVTQTATEQQRVSELAWAQHGVIEERLAEARTHFDESLSKLTSRFTSLTQEIASTKKSIESIGALRDEIEVLRQTVRQYEHALSETHKQHQRLAEEIQPLRFWQEKSETELLMQERRLTVLLETLGSASRAFNDRNLAEAAANEEDHLLDSLYAAFEDQFRGPRDEVCRRLEVYIPYLKEAGVRSDVLDLGCGRGEWLELLESQSIEGRGVDRNRIVIENCRRSGLNVLQQDALAYLRGLAPESLNVVTAFHLVEHLPFEMLVKLLDEAVRTLRRGGMLILETPNPENFMVGSCNFYTDPTHRNPIPSQTLRFLVESRGLKTLDVLKLRSWDDAKIEGDAEIVKRFNEYFYCAPDYAVLAKKP